MSGVIAARHVLIGDAALIALVPATSIGAGALPLHTPLPAISLESVTRLDRQVLGNFDFLHVAEHVQVTVLAETYDDQVAVQSAIRSAIRNGRFPTVAGLDKVTVHNPTTGPDFMNAEATIYMGTQDLRVTFSEPR